MKFSEFEEYQKFTKPAEVHKAGAKVIIVNETDFWDAVDDKLAGIEG